MEPFLLLLLLMIRAGIHCHAKSSHSCASSTCGELRNISYPFRLKDDPKGCGDSRFELACEDNRTMLSLKGGKYQVKSMTPTFFGDMVVVDVGLRRSDCSSLPLHPLMSSSFSDEEDDGYSIRYLTTVIIVSCSKQVRSSYRLYIPTEPCIAVNGYYSYAIIHPWEPSDIEDSCTVTTSTGAADYLSHLAYSSKNRTISYHDVHNAMADGFTVAFDTWRPMRTIHFCFLGFRYGGKRCLVYPFGKYACSPRLFA